MDEYGNEIRLDGLHPHRMSRRENIFLVLLALVVVAVVSIAPIVVIDYF